MKNNNPFYILDVFDESDNNNSESESDKKEVVSNNNEIVKNKENSESINKKPVELIIPTEKIYERKFSNKIYDNPDLLVKRILCYNILKNGMCNYGNKCKYAHTLDEQNIDPGRKKSYDIIMGKFDLAYINLLENKELHRNFLQLTKICLQCSRNICPGGHNCKFGAINDNYQICFDDLQNGDCYKKDLCKYIHLTKRNLVPYNKLKGEKSDKYKEKNKKLYSDIIKIKTNESSPVILQSRNMRPTGTLLSDDFFSHIDTRKKSNSDSDESMESVDKVIKYLNEESIDSCDESIFEI